MEYRDIRMTYRLSNRLTGARTAKDAAVVRRGEAPPPGPGPSVP